MSETSEKLKELRAERKALLREIRALQQKQREEKLARLKARVMELEKNG